ncbi:MAG: LemA family protein [Candidatus Omnitrophica bacterium]|nr:LemA family protein [Candidatus Omnitrophota bacterium]
MYILLAILVVVAVVFVGIYNRFIRLSNLTKEAWSGIDVQLKRRYDLIPKIVDTVKGYAEHEKNLLEEVTSIRSRLLQMNGAGEKGNVENHLSHTLKSIFALAENYPDLKANQGFLELQKMISEVEDQIQMARRYYNGTVRDYNICVEAFPSNLIANLLNYKPRDFFEIEYATERKSPDVRF